VADKNINIVFWLPGAAEAEPVEAKHRAMDSLPKKHQKSFCQPISFFDLKMPARNARKPSTC